MKSSDITGRLLTRNAMINLIGVGLPLVVAVVTIPFVIRGLGIERFGILAFAWALLGYFNIFDLGLGRATTKFVSEALGKGKREKVPSIVRSAVTAQAVFGFLGGLLLAVITPLLVERYLNIRQNLVAETKLGFYLLSFSIPALLVSSSFRGALEAAQRFDVLNMVRAPFSAANFLLPLVGVFLGFGIPGIIALLVVFQWLATAIFGLICIRFFPPLRLSPSFKFTELRMLANFGAWVMVSSIAGPFLVYMDRFMIGTLLTMTSVAYYSAPFEIVSRSMIVPSSLVASLFPAFSTLSGSNKQARQIDILMRSLKYLFLFTGPIVIMMIIFAKDILNIWLGVEYSRHSTLVFQILFVGMFLNSLARLPHSLIHGIGRPDITAKFHLLELLPYIGLAWFLIGKFAIVGAALAWTCRVAIDGFLLWGAAWKLIRIPHHLMATGGLLRDTLALVGLSAAFKIVVLSNTSFPIQAILAVVIMILFGLFAWCYSLDPDERNSFKIVLRQFVNVKATRCNS